MKIRLLSIIALLLALSLSACAPADNDLTQVTNATAPSSTEESGTPAPDFTVYDLEGNPVKLSDFQGKPVVLNFWASWCPPCKSEMPDFDEAYAAYGEEVHFLMVNLTDGTRETVSSAKEFISDSGYSFPVYCDTNSEAATAYQVYSIPTTYFIDAQGCIVAYGSGAMDMATLEKGIGMIYEASEAPSAS